jgi:hypothetical protein
MYAIFRFLLVILVFYLHMSVIMVRVLSGEMLQVKTTLTKLIQKSENTTQRLRMLILNYNITALRSSNLTLLAHSSSPDRTRTIITLICK